MGQKEQDVSAQGAGTTNMTAYLESLLKQLEVEQGGEDKEATEALGELKKEMIALAAAEERSSSESNTGAAPDDMQLASALDRLDDRLKDFEAQLNSADEPTKQILQQSTELWLGENPKTLQEEDVNGPIKGAWTNDPPSKDKT